MDLKKGHLIYYFMKGKEALIISFFQKILKFPPRK